MDCSKIIFLNEPEFIYLHTVKMVSSIVNDYKIVFDP